ncbi:MAG: hypothetical protein WA110_08190 [Anaerolineaceae bacterium]
MDVERIQAYYSARGLSWPDQKNALLFYLSEVGELAEAYLAQPPLELSPEEQTLLADFCAVGQRADGIVSRVPGWVRNHDRLRKENIRYEVADCHMMLAVFMNAFSGGSPDDALLEKMQEKMGRPFADLLAPRRNDHDHSA